MSLNNQQIDKLQFLRNYQPSAIRSSILMAIIQAVSFVGSFILMGLSIYVYASPGKTMSKMNHHNDDIIKNLKHQLHLQSENSIEQAYLLMVIGVLLLLIWKLTTMVRNRNAYILLVNELLDEE